MTWMGLNTTLGMLMMERYLTNVIHRMIMGLFLCNIYLWNRINITWMIFIGYFILNAIQKMLSKDGILSVVSLRMI